MGRKLKSLLLILFLFPLFFSVKTLVNKESVPVQAVSTPSCYGLTISKTQAALNEAVNINASVSGYGIIRMAKVSAVGKRVVEGAGAASITRGYNTLRAIFSAQSPGVYVFEVNAYNSNKCNFLCTAGKILYKNTNLYGGGCDTAGHWQTSGSCTSNSCIKWLTVGNPPSPTPTPTPVCVRRGSAGSAGQCNFSCQAYCPAGYYSCNRSLSGRYCVIPDMVCGWLSWDNIFHTTSGACCCKNP